MKERKPSIKIKYLKCKKLFSCRFFTDLPVVSSIKIYLFGRINCKMENLIKISDYIFNPFIWVI